MLYGYYCLLFFIGCFWKLWYVLYSGRIGEYLWDVLYDDVMDFYVWELICIGVEGRNDKERF